MNFGIPSSSTFDGDMDQAHRRLFRRKLRERRLRQKALPKKKKTPPPPPKKKKKKKKKKIYVANAVFPSAVVVLPEGADRAVRERDAVRRRIWSILATRPSARRSKTVADRQISGAARRGARPDRPGIEHHHRISDRHYPGRIALHSRRCRAAWQMRLRDRFYDLYVTCRCRRSSATGCVRRARIRTASSRRGRGCATAYGMIEREMAAGTWAMGDAFSIADCAAAPALFYANKVMPFGDAATWPPISSA